MLVLSNAPAYAAQGLTVSKREFPLPGEVPESDEVANLPDDLLDRDDKLGKLMQQAFNFAPPPPPPCPKARQKSRKAPQARPHSRRSPGKKHDNKKPGSRKEPPAAGLFLLRSPSIRLPPLGELSAAG